MIQLEQLTTEQITSIYNEHMLTDFPPREMKPLSALLDARERDLYTCYGIFSEGELAGYVFLEHSGGDYLIDYIAMFPEKRNGGLGGQLLSVLMEELYECDSVIGEVEDPAFAETEADRSLQTRRLGFYLRNGIIDTGMTSVCFGARYKILELPTGRTHSPEELRELYIKHYRVFFSEEECARGIQI